MQKVNPTPVVEKFYVSPTMYQPTLAAIKKITNVHSAICRDYNGYTKFLIVVDGPNQSLAHIILAMDTSLLKIIKTTTNAQQGTITIITKQQHFLLN